MQYDVFVRIVTENSQKNFPVPTCVNISLSYNIYNKCRRLNDSFKEADTMSYVELRDVRKTYIMGENKIHAADGVNLSIEKGEFCVIVGPSGAGKTTVLNILGGMDTVTSGTVILDGRNISKMSAKELTLYRRYDVGFVFQFYNLVQNLTALENVELANEICEGNAQTGGTGKPYEELPRSAVGRRAAARFHSARDCQKPENSALRRTHRRARLRDRQERARPAPEDLPRDGKNGHNHNA